jgi:ABC-type phosphate/phosphonate transport system substrate-binding protein
MSRVGLPMYDHARVRGLVDDWWRGLARALAAEGIAELPARLDRATPREALWAAPDLLLSQTCGYPLMYGFRGRLALVATPCYDAPGAEGSSYGSHIVVAEASPAAGIADLEGSVAAINGADSHSGMNAFRHLVAPQARDGRFFAAVVTSGGHAESIALVAGGEADVAAIDCVTHALLARHAPEALAGTRVLTRTASAPALPYVTRIDASADLVARLRAGLARAVADPRLAPVREALLIRDFEVLALAAYERMPEMEAEAARAGYPVLA